MPAFNYQSSINNLNLTPPITFTITIPYDNLQNAESYIGQVVNNTVIQGARYGLYFYVCANKANCQNPQYALSIVFRAEQDGYYIEFDPGPFYISNPPILSFQYPVQNLNSDVVITVTFQGDTITVTGNGQQIISVNMLESFASIEQLASSSWYFTTGGQQVTLPASYMNYLAFLVSTSTPFDLSSLLNSFIPLIAIVPLFSLLPQIISGLTGFVKRRKKNQPQQTNDQSLTQPSS